MATNTDRPVGPGTFTRDGYSVTIAADGKIRVRENDWLSKYSRCLYGDYDTLDVFVRPDPPLYAPIQEIKGVKEIEDVDRITTGEFLVHVPTYFHWAEKRGRPRIPPTPPKDGVDPGDRLEKLVRFIHQWLCPVTDLKFKGSSGLDLSAAIFAAHYCAIDVLRTGEPAPTRFHAVGAGLNWGPEDLAPWPSVTISPSDFPSRGCVLKSPLVGRTLSLDEICGNYLLMDLSGGAFLGGSLAALFFGFNLPAETVLRAVVGYLRGTTGAWPILPSIMHGVVYMAGFNVPTPTLGVSLKSGWMHRLECVTG
jgi:hypothetical protein